MISICIATYGDEAWRSLAWSRAYPSTVGQGAEVVVVHQEDGTCASARNAAAAEATGDWLIMCDADDELAPGYVDAMHQAIRGPAMYLPQTSFTKNGIRRSAHFFPWCDLMYGNPMIIGTMMPRKEFLEVGGFTEGIELFEDWMLFAKLWRRGITVERVPDAIYVAHMVRGSRNRRTHGATRLYWHMFVGHAVFPEHYAATTPEEDEARRLSSPKIRLTQ